MKVINIILSGYFILASFIPRMDFSQLTYLDDIYIHYQEHILQDAQSDSGLSFADFIYIHYINPEAHNEEEHGEHNHDQLPFLSFQYQFVAISDSNPRRAVYSDESFTYASTYEDPFYLKEFSVAIFHPPSLKYSKA